MKHFFLLLLITPLFLVSCTNDETIDDLNTNKNMLESYAIKRNANGSYTLTHVVSEGVQSIYNDDVKLNEVQLFYDGKALDKTFTHNYNIIDNELNINFLSENRTFQPKIKIIDDSPSERGVYGLLNDYTVSENANGTIKLQFEVDPGVSVAYSYNAVEKINDVILSLDENATQQSFTKVFPRENNGTLKIDFVQPAPGREIEYKKPRIIFEEPPAL